MSTNYIEVNPRNIRFAHKANGGAFWNARQTFVASKDASTKEDIRLNGLTHSPSIRQLVSGEHELICGERRLRCILALLDEDANCYSKATGKFEPATKVYKSLTCNLEVNCDDRRASILSVRENLERENISELDLMAYCQDLVSKKKPDGDNLYSRKDVAEIIGRSEGWVSQTLSFFALPDRAKEMLATGALPRSTAIYLLKVNADKIDTVLNVLEAMTAQELEEQTTAVEQEIQVIEEQIEVTSASEAIGGSNAKISKSKQLLQEKLEQARGKKKKITMPRVTPERLQAAADLVPNSRHGKAIAMSYKAMRVQRDKLAELRDGLDAPFRKFDLELSIRLIDMFLGESADREAVEVLENLYRENNL